ncbi:hypothetical protein BD324DRAFT_636070 [Kockovaella imperatae]|uniref:DUF221-domain-containing protein n=1 Tax=Kockovaella imperatae TaxID=4999 RepID=A0A1Y1UBL5_9TREE|nr:hypothetical protein BD324DRAFT_636070 [Kockovaella imperatae]ORX34475.1 hypothetical protein BD324DRAFT_636070 [Kockovaella imperatae]
MLETLLSMVFRSGDDEGGGNGGGAPPGSPPTQKFEGPWFSTQMILALSIGVTSFLVFCFLRTKWDVVYMGRTKLKDFSPTPAHEPDAHHGRFFGWILPTLRTSEFTVLQTVGLDAAVLLNFYRMAFFLFTLLACLAGVVLMPLNLFRHGSTDSEYDPPTDGGSDNSTLIGRLLFDDSPSRQNRTIPDNQSVYDYLLDPQLSNTINMVFTYIFTALTLLFIHQNFHRFIQSRQSFALHLIHSVPSRTVLVKNVPPHLRGDRALAEYFEACGWMIESVNVCRETEPLRKLLEKRTNALLKLERAWVDWVGNPANVRGHDPNIYGELGKARRKGTATASPEPVSSSIAEGRLIPDITDEEERRENGSRDFANGREETAETEEIRPLNGEPGGDPENGQPHVHIHTTRPRPTFRPRYFGTKVDAIEYWETKFRVADEQVRQARRTGSFPATHVAFVTFEDVRDAQTACQVVHFPEHSEVITTKAPEPRDVVWSLVSISQRETVMRQLVVSTLIIILFLTWIPPVSTIATLLNYNEIKRVLPWLARLIDRSPRLEALVQNSLPSVSIITFNGLLPFLLGWLSYEEGWKSRSAIEYSLLRKYHFFLLVTIVFIFLLTSTFWALVRNLANSPAQIPEKLAKALSTSNVKPFMISYVILQSMGLMPLQLLNLGPLFSLGWARLTSVKTPRDYAEAYAPPMLNYGWVYPQALLVFTITLTFSVVMPLILIFGALYFGVAYLVYKYKLLFMYFKPYESNGEAWRITFHRLLWGVMIFQIFMTGLFSLQKPYWLFFAMVPLVLWTLWWSWTTDAEFKGLSEYVALSSICEVARGEGADQVVGVAEEDTVTRSQANLNHRRYAINDETLYVAPSDKRTDYSQPPMNNFYYGVLNTGRRRYAHPALTGSLPYPWLPAPQTPKKFGDGAAKRRGVVLSLRRKMAKKLRRTQTSDSESDARIIPDGWATGENLSESSRQARTDTRSTSQDEGEDDRPDGGKLGSSLSSVSNPWRDPTPEPSSSNSYSRPRSKMKKSMSFDPASGVIALPEEENVWGDMGSSEDEDEGENRDEDDGVPQSPSTYFPHPERKRTISVSVSDAKAASDKNGSRGNRRK